MNGDKKAVLERPSFSFMFRRFVGGIYNIYFIILFIIAFSFFGFILSAIVTFITGSLSIRLTSVFFLLSPIAAFLYMSYRTSKGRQTHGHKTMGLRVVDQNGNGLTFSKSILRNLLWLACAIPFGLGIIWALSNRSGRGLHDAILGTQVVSKDDVNIPLLTCVPFMLSFICVFCIVFLMGAIAGLISFSGFVQALLTIMFFMIPSTFILGLISKIVMNRKGKDELAIKISNQSMTLSVIAGFIFIIAATAIPSRCEIIQQIQEARCEEDMKTIALAADNYILNYKCHPRSMADLMKANFRSEIPKFQYGKEYIYRVDARGGNEIYIIECPDPGILLKSRGLLPPKKCLGIQYIQGEGMIVKTE